MKVCEGRRTEQQRKKCVNPSLQNRAGTGVVMGSGQRQTRLKRVTRQHNAAGRKQHVARRTMIDPRIGIATLKRGPKALTCVVGIGVINPRRG